jgi:hypothetical protein
MGHHVFEVGPNLHIGHIVKDELVIYERLRKMTVTTTREMGINYHMGSSPPPLRAPKVGIAGTLFLNVDKASHADPKDAFWVPEGGRLHALVVFKVEDGKLMRCGVKDVEFLTPFKIASPGRGEITFVAGSVFNWEEWMPQLKESEVYAWLADLFEQEPQLDGAPMVKPDPGVQTFGDLQALDSIERRPHTKEDVIANQARLPGDLDNFGDSLIGPMVADAARRVRLMQGLKEARVGMAIAHAPKIDFDEIAPEAAKDAVLTLDDLFKMYADLMEQGWQPRITYPGSDRVKSPVETYFDLPMGDPEGTIRLVTKTNKLYVVKDMDWVERPMEEAPTPGYI